MPNPVQLDTPGVLSKVAQSLTRDIDDYCLKAAKRDFRRRMGASDLGEQCARRLWYGFRWVDKWNPPAKMCRVLETGNLDEPRIHEYLRGIGCTVSAFTDDGKQHFVEFANGHGGGGLDALVRLPEAYGIDEELLLEGKTQATTPKFTALTKGGVALEQPMHFTQMSVYGARRKIRYALYVVRSKNDESLHIEIVKLDWRLGDERVARAEEIVRMPTPPVRFSESSKVAKCTTCDMHNVCFKGKQAHVNCRSCRFAEPVADGKWFCHHHQNGPIPDAVMSVGCGEPWRSII